MAFTLPTFNLSVNIIDATGVPFIRSTTVGNLSPGRRVAIRDPDLGGLGESITMFLSLPAGTDVRSPYKSNGHDIVEVPAGSQRYYTVTDVDDVAKGFSNEYRLASLFGYAPYAWPVPYP